MNENQWIYQVVDAFYAKAKIDILIGYHFRVVEDFEEHIPRIVSFWELQLLGKSSRPIKEPFDLMKMHIPLGIKRGELGRWLLIFKKTLNEEVEKHPEFAPLKDQWLLKLDQFEKIFMRFFGF
jgi:truncated hemoglobin YjbI